MCSILHREGLKEYFAMPACAQQCAKLHVSITLQACHYLQSSLMRSSDTTRHHGSGLYDIRRVLQSAPCKTLMQVYTSLNCIPQIGVNCSMRSS